MGSFLPRSNQAISSLTTPQLEHLKEQLLKEKMDREIRLAELERILKLIDDILGQRKT